MTKFRLWLSGLLALQLTIAGGLFWHNQSREQQNLQQPLLAFTGDNVDQVVVSDGDNTTTLTKSDGGWQLAGLRLPVNNGKLTEVLTKLENLKTGWPVATTGSSHERFEVAADKFQRHVQLYRGDALADELYLGSSPGFRKTHVRGSRDTAVYSVALNSYELPAKEADWLDKSLLAASDIKTIQGPDYRLTKSADDWSLAVAENTTDETTGSAAAPQLDAEKAQQLASALTGLRVLGVADKQDDATSPESVITELKISAPADNWIYRFIQAGDQYYVSRNDRDVLFTISKFDYDRIAQTGMPQLAKDNSTPDEASEDKAQAG